MADRLSSLPDEILCHILSFLETEESVATSVLSKRWKNLWHSVPALAFYDKRVHDEKANFLFNEFVYSVLVSQKADLSIKKFCLKIEYDYPSNITKWVNFVLQRRLEYLQLYLMWEPDYTKIPIRIFSCRTLVVLELSGFTVEGFSSVVLPSLKSLHFEHCTFETVPVFMLLLLGCPILEDLFVYHVLFGSEECCSDWKNVSLCKLIRADIVFTFFDFWFNALQNVKYLRIEFDKVYVYTDVIPTFHNLTHLELFYLNYKWHLLAEVLNNCPKLQKIDLDQADMDEEYWNVEDLEDEYVWVDPELVPQCLSLHLRSCNLLNFLGLESELLLARYILKNAIVLETMGIWNKGNTNVKSLLSSCPRGSATCKLTVCGRP